ncbi:MAG: hypothetical protein AAGC85_08930 [Bacteroidota bacterium]
MLISTISNAYGTELRRLYYFAVLLLPLLSAFSLLTGHYFLSNSLLATALPELGRIYVWSIALGMVLIIELAKYFFAPLLSKLLWHKNWLMVLLFVPIVASFFGMSIFFSVHGVQDYLDDHDQTETRLQAVHLTKKDSLTEEYVTQLAEKDSLIHKLSQALGNDEILKRTDAINQRILSVQQRIRRTTNDSIKALSLARLNSLERDKRLLETSTYQLSFHQQQLGDMQSERRSLILEKEAALTKLTQNLEEELLAANSEQSFLANNIFYLSLGVELMILICLSFLQYYRLHLRHNSEYGAKSKLTVDRNSDTKTMEIQPEYVAEKENKYLSKEDQKVILQRFQKANGNAKALVPELMKEYGISKRTAYRYKKKAEEI